MTTPQVATGLKNLFHRRGQFVVIGLTGRTGSGCSTVARLLNQEFTKLNPPASKNSNPTPEDRKYRITRDYAAIHWIPFFSLSISNVIQSFLLDSEEEDLRKFLNLKDNKIKGEQIEPFIAEWRPASEKWKSTSRSLFPSSAPITEKEEFVKIWNDDLPTFFNTVKKGLGAESTRFLQTIGDNLRKSGNPFSNDFIPDNFYELPDRVVNIVSTIKEINSTKKRPTYIVLDAIRNPFELLYFRDSFPAFYVVAITTKNDEREKRLIQIGLNHNQIQDLDKKEYPDKNKPLSGYDSFTSQNIQSCLEKADIYLRNDGAAPPSQEINFGNLTEQLVRYFSLIIHPGIVTPTRAERCMQIAFSAKANSGCISRQVGAAITDQYGSIKAIGWNDVPEGQLPCILRNATDLLNNADESAFSVYEYKDKEFRKQLDKSYKRFKLVDMSGRSPAFCFKYEYNTLKDKDNQVHTRSLHAEENAFLQLAKYGGEGIKGGKLFTTASPCELCAKKAFQLGIKEIIYIDPYPGISMDHILQSGRESFRPEVELFQGSVGQAYHRLYDPILPYKDEIFALMQNSDTSPETSNSGNSEKNSLFLDIFDSKTS
ncbi:MAG: hypothetical protein U1D36_21730 [Hydrogenophaga sp.]|uniref:hypothetical protein n=1 Tax=Comamonadaceae TaxID=80864 RepID=UPI00272F4586|nr:MULTISPECIES: hypothetical protein [Comamonadaceae]MDP2440456.1 hypothetical protein [Rhodoferax sp.]MDZ4177080.1 hypothetical protein [Hydrogenophaga sp.]